MEKLSKHTKNRMRTLLNEVVEHYNSANRNQTDFGCIYAPTETSEGCAIGRKLPKRHMKIAKKCDELFNQSEEEHSNIVDLINGYYGLEVDISGIGVGSLFKLFKELRVGIPKVFRGLPQTFLSQLQSLHDCKDYWDTFGLSEEGQNKVKIIKERFEL